MERTPPAGPTRQQINTAAVERELRVRWTPAAPSGEGVVPLWYAHREAEQQARRWQALHAAEANHPDTGYTYKEAHHLAGAAA
ncbi:hypothetical protein [Kitasatospora sp. MMS16-BH015]|uniref:hypothetical protein n=1 Tax=Kitasatospora sp. MMS16-BH015 TaxID=2018025 RepID=UPI00131A5A1D|nr:hypothetical protein [Kitasatospora sp. MMS16-BH015]